MLKSIQNNLNKNDFLIQIHFYELKFIKLKYR